MAEYKDMVITNKGKELINRQIIGEKNFEITKIAVGTGIHEDTEDLKECEDLKEPLKDYEIYSMERKGGAVEIKSVVTNISYEREALLNEVGVYASDGTDEILYAIATAVYPLQIPAYNGEFEYKIDFVMHFTIDSGVGVILRDRTDIATEKAAGAVKASEDIKVEADGTMRIADYESDDSDDIAGVPEYQVNLTEPPSVGKGCKPSGWKEVTAIKQGEKLPSVIRKLTNIAYNVKWLFKWLNSINTIGEYTSVDSKGNIIKVKNNASDIETGLPFPFPIQTVVEGHEAALRQLNTETRQSTNGKFILPDGLMVQWGTVGYSGPLEITFPIPYKQIPHVSVSGFYQTDAGVVSVHTIRSIEKTGFTTRNFYSTVGESQQWGENPKISSGYTWIAVGY